MAGFTISSKDGKRPWAMKLMIAIWLLSFIVAFGLITWRDVSAPHSPSADYPDTFRGNNDVIYYVPRWFTPLFLLCICLIGVVSVVIPALQIFFFIVQVKKKMDEMPRYSPPSGP